MTTWALFYGRKRKALAHVRADATWPGMWRIHWPGGEVSDMVNLSRAKDAAVVLARQRHPELAKSPGVRWRWEVAETVQG
jgi:hypothetical protein